MTPEHAIFLICAVAEAARFLIPLGLAVFLTIKISTL